MCAKEGANTTRRNFYRQAILQHFPALDPNCVSTPGLVRDEVYLLLAERRDLHFDLFFEKHYLAADAVLTDPSDGRLLTHCAAFAELAGVEELCNVLYGWRSDALAPPLPTPQLEEKQRAVYRALILRAFPALDADCAQGVCTEQNEVYCLLRDRHLLRFDLMEPKFREEGAALSASADGPLLARAAAFVREKGLMTLVRTLQYIDRLRDGPARAPLKRRAPEPLEDDDLRGDEEDDARLAADVAAYLAKRAKTSDEA